MKRSRTIRLALLGSASLMTLTACEQADPLTDGRFFADAQACEAAYDAEACNQALADARQEHVQTAPRFANREECEAEFGVENCMAAPQTADAGAQQTEGQQASTQTAGAQTGGSWFMPMMMGYMMGNMMGGRYAAAPVYRDTQNTAYSGKRAFSRFDSAAMPPPRSVAGTAGVPKFEMQRRESVARRGFGGTGSRFGGGS